MTSGKRWRDKTTMAASLAVALAMLSGPLTSPRPVHAQGAARASALSDAQKRQIKEHYDKANRYYTVGKYPEAIAEFEAAYLIGADPKMIFNIAQSYRLNNQPEEAARFYRNYLRNAPDAANRAEVEKKIIEMDTRAAERRRAGPAVTPPAETPFPSTSPPVTTPPPVGGTAPAPGTPATGWPSGTAGSPSVGEPAGSVAATAPTVERRRRVWPMVLMVSGGVLVTTSLVLGGVAANKAKEVERRASGRNLPFDADTQKLEEDGKAASAGAVTLGLLGLAVGAGGLYWWLRSAPEEPAATSAVFPLAGPGLYGAGARVAF